ncbi:hypothetical protein V5O48_016134, partial [Marasmius crinis-equi]
MSRMTLNLKKFSHHGMSSHSLETLSWRVASASSTIPQFFRAKREGEYRTFDEISTVQIFSRRDVPDTHTVELAGTTIENEQRPSDNDRGK